MGVSSELIEEAFYEHANAASSIRTADAVTLVQSLGCAPSLEDIEAFEKKTRGACSLQDLKQWIKTLEASAATAGGFHNFVELFETFDPEKTGYVRQKVMKSILTKVGEPLTEEEFKSCIKDLANDEDPVHYKTFLQK